MTVRPFSPAARVRDRLPALIEGEGAVVLVALQELAGANVFAASLDGDARWSASAMTRPTWPASAQVRGRSQIVRSTVFTGSPWTTLTLSAGLTDRGR